MVHAMVNSEKRIGQITLTNIAEFGSEHVVFVEVKQDVGAGTDANAVTPGTTIKAVYLEMWLQGDSNSATSSATGIVTKIPASAANPTNGELGDLNTYANKKNVLITHQGLLAEPNGNPTPFFREWIAIPKGKQRFGLGDRLVLSIRSITGGTNICGFFLFKAYN